MTAGDDGGARRRAAASLEERPRDLPALLRSLGLRVTAQRLLILEAIRDTPGHISAEEVYQKVVDRLPSLSIVSVYRTLEFFAERGIVSGTSLGERALQWEWHAGTEHHHLICRSCGHQDEIGEALFAGAAAQLEREHGFHAELRHLALWGTCARCWSHQHGGQAQAPA
jgi:Fur family ferric uptake transcriptional regulator